VTRGHSAKRLVWSENLSRDGRRITDQERSFRGAHDVAPRARSRRPAALSTDLGKHVLPARIKNVPGLPRRFRYETGGVDPNLQKLGRMAGAPPRGRGRPTDGSAGTHRDDRDHQRQAERAGACEGLRRTAHADPDGLRFPIRPRIDALSRKGRPEASGPAQIRGFAQFQ
jgi:hypothetical protein